MKDKKGTKITPFLSEDSPDRFEAVIHSISDGVFTVDKDWRITCFNRAAERITGIMRSQAMGRKCHEILKSNICKDACAIQYTIETGRPIINLAVYLTDRNGTQVPVNISTALFRNIEGELIGGVATFRDLRQVEKLRKKIARIILLRILSVRTKKSGKSWISCPPSL